MSAAPVPPSKLVVEGLRANVGNQEILRGIDLEVASGEVHAVMGPNGSGKSTLAHILLGRPGYTVTGGRVTLDGVDLLGLATWERAQAGLFLAMQHPIEVPGVRLADVLAESLLASGATADGGGTRRDGDAAGGGGGAADPVAATRLAATEAARVGLNPALLDRPLNVDLSGGEAKRNETVQLGVLRPRIALLDEIDSGLDVDALRAVSARVEAATTEFGLGVLAITHFARLLTVLRADRVHVLLRGRIVTSGGPELAEELETTGYAAWADPAA